MKKDPDTLDKSVESMEIGGDVLVLAAGVASGKSGRKVGINLPMYPLKGRVVDIPLKVKNSAQTLNFTPLRRGKTETNSNVPVIQLEYLHQELLNEPSSVMPL